MGQPALALWAMSVPATKRHRVRLMTVLALVSAATQGAGPACCQRPQHLPLLRAGADRHSVDSVPQHRPDCPPAGLSRRDTDPQLHGLVGVGDLGLIGVGFGGLESSARPSGLWIWVNRSARKCR